MEEFKVEIDEGHSLRITGKKNNEKAKIINDEKHHYLYECRTYYVEITSENE
jgi:hypothetical protein